jgi:hypothetical protein
VSEQNLITNENATETIEFDDCDRIKISDVEYIDRLIPEGFISGISNMMIGDHSSFAWYYGGNSTYNTGLMDEYVKEHSGVWDNVKDLGQFEHLFFSAGDSRENQQPIVPDEVEFERIHALIWFLMNNFPDLHIKNLLRVKANLIYNPNGEFEKKYIQTPHVDSVGENFKSLLFYVNDSDGDTIIYNETYDDMEKEIPLTEKARFTPKAGSAILFNSNLWHVAELPVVNDRRCVINFIFECFTKEEMILMETEKGREELQRREELKAKQLDSDEDGELRELFL